MSTPERQRAAARRYFDACRSRIPGFVRRHFSIGGTLELHREALGGDLWRAPLNTLLAVPVFVVRLSACLSRCVRLKTLSRRLEAVSPGVTTALERKVEYLVLTELLALPATVHGRLSALAPLSRMLYRYVRARGAASEIGVNVVMLCAGALLFQRLTPGSISAGTAMAHVLSERTAVDAFPLGTWAGEAYYSVVPVAFTPSDMAIAAVATLGAVALLSTFVGIVADPVQSILGIHRRRLNRLIDALERRMMGGDADFQPKDAYFARLLDAVDAARAAGALLR